VHLGILATTFGLIFLAELPDKTAYTVLLLASRGRPLPVLFGSWAAFLAQGFVAVALGSLISRLPPAAVRWTTAALFLAFGLFLLLGKEAPEEEAPPPGTRRKMFVQAFAMVFLA
jgi:Ca2+/H+ antiporter, TMEM165/GDT1 family